MQKYDGGVAGPLSGVVTHGQTHAVSRRDRPLDAAVIDNFRACSGTKRGGYGATELDNVYEEVYIEDEEDDNEDEDDE